MSKRAAAKKASLPPPPGPPNRGAFHNVREMAMDVVQATAQYDRLEVEGALWEQLERGYRGRELG